MATVVFRFVLRTMLRQGFENARKGVVPVFSVLPAALLLCVLTMLLPGHAEAASHAPLGQPAFIVAMSGDASAQGAPPEGMQRPGGSSMSEQLFKGSFIGALLFGYPYEGFGAMDIAGVAVVALVALRLLARKGARTENDKFTVQRREDPTQQPGSGRPAWPGQEKPEQERKNTPANPANPADPRDNAWSRRLSEQDRNDPEKPGSGWNQPANNSKDQSWDWGQVADRNRSEPDAPASEGEPAARQKPVTMKDKAAQLWGYYSDEGGSANRDASPAGARVAPGVQPPPGFDVADFLEGARTLYVRLQKAWAARKVDELEPFVSARLFDLLKSQAAKDPYPVQVDILLVDAELMDVRQQDDREDAAVNFSVSMRTGGEARPDDIHELWRFTRGRDSGGMWRLEGIEQP